MCPCIWAVPPPSLSQKKTTHTHTHEGHSNSLTKCSTNNLRLVTFNCHGFNTATHDITLLCNQYDVICVQELWLNERDMSLLKTVHPDFDGIGIRGPGWGLTG